MTKLIALANQKGGVGKTTTSVNLAFFLAKSGAKTLLIDFDPQGNASSHLGIPRSKRKGSRLLFLEAQDMLQHCEQPMADLACYVIPSSAALANIAQEVLQRPPFPILKENLQKLQEEFEYVVIDCPPSPGAFTTAALTVVNYLIIPVQCEFFAMEGVSQMMASSKDIATRYNPALELMGILLTMYNPQDALCEEVYQEVHAVFQNKVFRSLIYRDVALAEAPSHGQPIMTYAPGSQGTYDYIQFAKEVCRHGDP